MLQKENDDLKASVAKLKDIETLNQKIDAMQQESANRHKEIVSMLKCKNNKKKECKEVKESKLGDLHLMTQCCNRHALKQCNKYPSFYRGGVFCDVCNSTVDTKKPWYRCDKTCN